MKRVNLKVLSLIAVMTVTAGSLWAQPRGGEAQRPEQKEEKTATEIAEAQTEMLSKEIELTDAQIKKINKINLSYTEKQIEQRAEREQAREQRKEAREQAKESGEDPRSEMQQQFVEIMGVLSDEQKVEYALLLSQRGGQGGQRGPQMGRGQGGPQGRQRGGQMGRGQGGPQGGQRGGQMGRPQGGPQGGGQMGRPQGEPQGAQMDAPQGEQGDAAPQDGRRGGRGGHGGGPRGEGQADAQAEK